MPGGGQLGCLLECAAGQEESCCEAGPACEPVALPAAFLQYFSTRHSCHLLRPWPPIPDHSCLDRVFFF